MYVRISKTTPRFRTLHIFVIVANIYYSEMLTGKISKGKRHMGRSLEKTRCKLPRVLSQLSHIGRA